MDDRLTRLSYSSNLLLHSCPRKYQLTKLSTIPQQIDRKQQLTFDYGHMVGDGIADVFLGKTDDEIVWKLFLAWNPERLLDWDEEKNKSFFHAITAIQQFRSVVEMVYSDWEVLILPSGRPAIELGFYMQMPEGFKYRGFVDIVLQHRVTKKIRVIEAKTNSNNYVNPAQYQNSSQAIGYSLVIDLIAPEHSEYDVTYAIYSTKRMEWDVPEFNKSYQARGRWIRELLLDAQDILSYDSSDFWPTHGEHCISYGRECNFLGVCHMDTKQLVNHTDPEDIPPENMDNYDFVFSLEDVIKAQQKKVGAL